MTRQTEPATKPSEDFFEAAKKELDAFERKESEFRQKLRQERAAELQFPCNWNDPNCGVPQSPSHPSHDQSPDRRRSGLLSFWIGARQFRRHLSG